MERHAAARAARLEFAAFLNRLREVAGIERQKVAELMGVPPSTVSRMAAERVKDRPTLAPPANWREMLAPALRRVGGELQDLADALDDERGALERGFIVNVGKAPNGTPG